MPNDINTQLRKLPYGTLRGLDQYLEPVSNKDWRALISVMPADRRYSRSQVDLIAVNGIKPGSSCTGILLQDMCQRCLKLKDLGSYLKKIENYEALEALDWPPEAVVITLQPECSILREGTDLSLRVEAFGYPLPSYQWYRNEEELFGEELNELRVAKVTMAHSGTYKCIVSNNVNSVCSNEVKVCVMKAPESANVEKPKVDSKPVITIQPVSCNVLHGERHTLRCQATGEQPITYVWHKDGQPLLNTNSPTFDIPAFTLENVGGYCCKVSNASGADVSDIAELTLERIDRPRNTATDKVALLIGNEDYTAAFHNALQSEGKLQHTIADTKTLASLLHRDDMGFNVLALGNLTRLEMVKGIGEYVNLLSEDSYAFFYYAGHGFELNGKHYLVPVDAPADWSQEDAICVQWILELIWKARPKLTVIILDMCRVRPNTRRGANFEEYDFPTDLKIVFGFATCSQSESYERIEEENGIYMKYLKEHISRDVKIEDILHDVTTDVGQDTSGCIYTERQRPEYISNGGGYYSLRDPVVPHGNRSAERWLEAHKLPEKRVIEFDDGIKVEVRFQHSDWLSNSVNILVGVIDPGLFDKCFAYIYQLPNGLEMHFRPDCQNRIIEDEPSHTPDVRARSMPDMRSTDTALAPANERSTGMFHLQRLHDNLTVTIALDCESQEVKSTKYKVIVFSARDFGLAQVFGGEW